MSFAYLVYSSSWIKYHYPAEFAAALLNAQPMGFYSPHTIVRDAAPPRRAGARSRSQRVAARRDARTAHRSTSSPSAGRCAASTPSRRTSRCGSGCAACAGCTTRCSTASTTNGPSTPFTDLEDFVRRTGATVDQVEALATAGAFEHCFGQSRRVRVVGRGRARHRAARTSRRDGTVVETLPGVVTGTDAPPLPGMTEMETVYAELWAMGLSVGKHPTEFVRDELRAPGRRDRSATCASCPTARWWRSREWSRTASNRRPRRARCS